MRFHIKKQNTVHMSQDRKPPPPPPYDICQDVVEGGLHIWPILMERPACAHT